MATSTGMRGRTSGNLGGRPALTSAHRLAEVAQELFLTKGFAETTIADITAAAGVSQRTFFRYFTTKADVLWVETSAEQARLQALLDAAPPEEPYHEVLYRAIPAALHHPPEEHTWALHRAQLLLTAPAVQAQAAARYAEWRASVTRFAAARLDSPPDDLLPTAVGAAALTATLTAHEYWITHPTDDLPTLLERLLQLLIPRPDGSPSGAT
ncbi:acyl-CoA-like ligand-binding transcription factor [Streptomyces brasiliensis]|uniref:HTH tetR-type domain-containing protein n=1 Tax=Streptomyces brasiliensis TaxID=1954 RepID=A0A917LAI2_9ACTN|nr:TetR family transcriptional regulator [Streptomyces brasiliensis]GGJ55985.1 hypothetical protein GCM10010121_078210 [Streptomyces brasiliensis]